MILVFFWKIKARYIPWAILHMGLDRLALARRSDVKFWKLLGAGKGETFTPRDADVLRWGLLVVVDQDSEIANSSYYLKSTSGDNYHRYISIKLD